MNIVKKIKWKLKAKILKKIGIKDKDQERKAL